MTLPIAIEVAQVFSQIKSVANSLSGVFQHLNKLVSVFSFIKNKLYIPEFMKTPFYVFFYVGFRILNMPTDKDNFFTKLFLLAEQHLIIYNITVNLFSLYIGLFFIMVIILFVIYDYIKNSIPSLKQLTGISFN
ncbi:hypothetical protein AB837_00233 [bacterium AB1]|nr:hypothetical protein AB837_00233 [bacterium AB1]